MLLSSYTLLLCNITVVWFTRENSFGERVAALSAGITSNHSLPSSYEGSPNRTTSACVSKCERIHVYVCVCVCVLRVLLIFKQSTRDPLSAKSKATFFPRFFFLFLASRRRRAVTVAKVTDESCGFRSHRMYSIYRLQPRILSKERIDRRSLIHESISSKRPHCRVRNSVLLSFSRAFQSRSHTHTRPHVHISLVNRKCKKKKKKKNPRKISRFLRGPWVKIFKVIDRRFPALTSSRR